MPFVNSATAQRPRLRMRFLVTRTTTQMKNAHFVKCLGLVLAYGLLLSDTTAIAQQPSRDVAAESSPREAKQLAGFFQKHCVKCHGEKEQQSGLRLDELGFEITDDTALTRWQDVLDVLNTAAMPPEGEQQPKSEELQKVIGAITDNVQDARKRLAATGGVIKMRHLTKREYLGSMKDLFGIEPPHDSLPDDTSSRFDTHGSEQFFSLKHYEGFYKAGSVLVQKSIQAVVSPLPESKTVRHDPEIAPFEAAKAAYEKMVKTKELIDAGAPLSEISKVDPKIADAGQVKLFINRYPVRSKKPIATYENLKGKKGLPGGFSFTTEIRPRSLYKVTVNALETVGGDIGISVDGESVGSVKIKAGNHQTSSELTFTTGILDSTINIRVSGSRNDVYDYLNLAGPFEDDQSKPAFFESVVKPVAQNHDASDREITAMLKRFADRAFRYQGVDDDYIAELMNVYKLERSAGKSVAESLVEPLTAIVTAPAFLYIKERNDGKRTVLSQLEFAIRAAYFLWGSPPDQELYNLARQSNLYDKGILQAQLERMLSSPKADVFLTDFINQWSDISRFDEIDLPVQLIRGGFQASARQELSEFFKVLVRENRPLDNLIDSDFVVVDARLAQYYGLDARRGAGFQKVDLPESSPRGGMLSQAAFLIIGGSGPRTSPTIRGAIVREKFLHDPVPPPPPNIPAIENEKGQELTVKQLVDRHKNVPQCASCHNQIDPIGYGLENFDYLGKWRTTEVLGEDATAGKKPKKRGKKDSSKSEPPKVAIDASGYLGDEQFEDFEGLKLVLLKNKDRLARSMYESLLSYGIGREIEFVDDDDVHRSLMKLEQNNYRLKDMILEVLTSKTFATK